MSDIEYCDKPEIFPSFRELLPQIELNEDEAIGNLIHEFKEHDVHQNIVRMLTRQIDTIEQDNRDIHQSELLNQGANLDAKGSVVGRPRILGQSDEEYDTDLWTQVLVNTNHKTIEEVSCIIKRELDLAHTSPDVQLEDLGYAWASCYIQDFAKFQTLLPPDTVQYQPRWNQRHAYVDSLFGAGITTEIRVLDENCTKAFAVSSIYSPSGDSADGGYSSIYDDTAPEAGCFVGLVNTDANSSIEKAFCFEDGDGYGYGSIYNTDPTEPEGMFISELGRANEDCQHTFEAPEQFFIIQENGSRILTEDSSNIKLEA